MSGWSGIINGSSCVRTAHATRLRINSSCSWDVIVRKVLPEWIGGLACIRRPCGVCTATRFIVVGNAEKTVNKLTVIVRDRVCMHV